VKVILIAQTFPPHVGGSPLRAHRIASGLAMRGHQVRVYTSIHPRAPQTESLNGLRIHRYRLLHPAVSRFIKQPYYIMPGMLRCLKENGDLRDADVVHTFHCMSFVSLLGVWIKVLRKRPLVLSPIMGSFEAFRQGLRARHKQKYGVRAHLSDWHILSSFLALGTTVARCADVVVSQTGAERAALIGYGVRPERIRVVPGALNADLYSRLPEPSSFRRRYSISPGEKLVLNVSQPDMWKGTPHLILAMRQVVEEEGSARLVLTGPFRRKATRFLSELGSPRLRERSVLTGPLVGRSLLEAYSAADVFVFPTRSEVFGTVLIEAAAAGLPIVSTRTGVAPDIISEGSNGLFVRYGDVRGLAAAVQRILSDDSFRREATRRRKSILKTYDTRAEVESYEQIYREALAGRID